MSVIAARKPKRLTLAAALVSVLATGLLVFWAFGPHELSPWRLEFMRGGNEGARSRAAAGLQPEVRIGHIDKPTLPVLAQTFLTDEPGFARAPGDPAGQAERAFTRFIALDATAAIVLAFALLLWRRNNPAAVLLAWTMALFALSLVCFLINGQARLRLPWLDWPSWGRLGSDITAILAFGLALIGLDRFFSIYPVKLEDWQVMATLRLRYGGKTNLLWLSRVIPKLAIGVMLAGTAVSSLPHLLMPLSYPMETRPDGAARPWQETWDIVAVAGAGLSALLVAVLLMAFGWLLSVSLIAKLRAGREHCTESERRQTDWLFAGGVTVAAMLIALSAGLVLGLLYLAWGDSEFVRQYGGSMVLFFFPTGWAVMLMALSGAVFLSGTFGTRPLLKRTVLVSAAGVLMGLLLATIEHSVAVKILHTATPGLEHGISAALAGGIVAFSLGLFRHRLEHGVDGLLQRFMPATVIAEGKRRDATVVFSDLAGYTALSAVDEPAALLQAGHLQKVAAAVAPLHRGRIVKTIGDAVMWVFPSPTDAMHAALALRSAFNSALAAEGLVPLPVNSGIHHGSVVEAPGGDLYGAAVNLAARLQGAAKEGAILASLEAVQEVSGEFRLQPLGRLELKNVPLPVSCFQVMPVL